MTFATKVAGEGAGSKDGGIVLTTSQSLMLAKKVVVFVISSMWLLLWGLDKVEVVVIWEGLNVD